MKPVDLIFRNAMQLLTCAGPAPRRGSAQAHAAIVTDGAVAARGGRIVFAGRDTDLDASVTIEPGAHVVDARRYSIVPGFVDAHTHAVYAGDRRDELRRRLSGATYAEIAADGGGILSTVAATRAAQTDDLVAQSCARLDEMLACGTTTCEIKSGYGLDTGTELKMLRAIRELAGTHHLDIVSTFLGAHDVPVEFRKRRDAYVDLVVDEMIPAVAREGLARWCDVFCEDGVFTPDESIRILEAGQRHGLAPRIHADELGPTGGSLVAARVGARSADHLIFVPRAGMDALAGAGVTATLLPAAAFYLKLGRFAPARDLIAAGVPVALATDVNPGGGFSPSMPFAMTLACFSMGLTFEEALIGATANAAWSLDCAGTVGSLEPGKLADLVLVEGEAINLIRVGAASIAGVVKRGRLVAGPMQSDADNGGL
ncbi:MAG: imidazolonepropionase [Acidobacteria bacterium]|nr:imidazolonepropionase [Acidobacteriota bacterium]MCA1651175.1 imidazolonepropionase [Acidobacteriota bacterium]